MTVGQVLAPHEARGGQPAPRPRPELVGRALWIGFVLLAVVALIDLVLLWVPVRFGNPDWEFGTFTQTVDSLPLLSMMTLGLVVVGLSRGSQTRLRLLAAWCAAVVLAIVAIVVLYLLNVPLIWQRAASPELATVLRKAIVKMVVLATLYVTLYGSLGALCLRGVRNFKLQ